MRVVDRLMWHPHGFDAVRPRFVLVSSPFEFVVQRELGTGAHRYVVVTVPARVRSVKVMGGHVLLHDHRLSFPPLLFVVELDVVDPVECLLGLYAYYLRGPYRGVQDVVCQTNLPNILANELVCQGDDTILQEDLLRATTTEERVRLVLADFWSRPFSDHSMHRFFASRTLHPAFTSFADWELASRKDPSFVERVTWQPIAPLQQVLDRLQGRFLR